MRMSEGEAKLAAWLICIAIGLSIVGHWFSPKGWIGIYFAEHRHDHER